MLNFVTKTDDRAIPIAKPRRNPVNIKDVYGDTMKRFPETMALLAE